jgi:hypothetical protein
MIRFYVTLMLLTGPALASSLHEQSIGTQIHGDFELGPKKLHLPAGAWTLIAAHRWTGNTNTVLQGTNFAGVYLAELKEGRLVRAVQAYTNIDPALHRGWRASVDPCKPREKALEHRDMSQNLLNQFCFDVNELRGYMKSSTGWRQDAQKWLANENVRLPPTVLVVRFAKIDRAYWTEVFYYFDAAELGRDAALKWAEDIAPAVRKGLDTPGP